MDENMVNEEIVETDSTDIACEESGIPKGAIVAGVVVFIHSFLD